MKTFFYLSFIISVVSTQNVHSENIPTKENDTTYFRFDKSAINAVFGELTQAEGSLKSGNRAHADSLIGQAKKSATIPEDFNQSASPGKIPSFWWSFVLSAGGTYTIYGAVLGPISVLVVYLASKRSKKEVRRAIWGWITGTLFGAGLWLYLRSLRV